MQEIPIRNKELTSILNGFIADLMTIETRGEALLLDRKKKDCHFACSNEYLLEMQEQKNPTGFPDITWGVDFHTRISELVSRKRIPPGFEKKVLDTDQKLLAWSGSRFNAVKMYYPPSGFMGWHHNANCPGYNILLSWSKDGTGFFRYQDPITKEIITVNDSPGWTCKVGYYGAWGEPDKIMWHCANAEFEERVTFGYVIPNIDMWESMCDDIQTA